MTLRNISFIISLLIVSINTGFAQISPGDLSKAHAHLEGASNCTQCHAVGNKVTREKCLACHQEIKNNIDANKGYHASKEVKGKNCAACHNDHHGRDFQLIKFDGDEHWSRAQRLLQDRFHETPVAVVHNGLLKLLFNNREGVPGFDIYQYAYDGNVLGPATISTELGAARSMGAAVLDGVMHVLYRGQP